MQNSIRVWPDRVVTRSACPVFPPGTARSGRAEAWNPLANVPACCRWMFQYGRGLMRETGTSAMLCTTPPHQFWWQQQKFIAIWDAELKRRRIPVSVRTRQKNGRLTWRSTCVFGAQLSISHRSKNWNRTFRQKSEPPLYLARFTR